MLTITINLDLLYKISLKNRHNNHKHEKETKSKEKNHVKNLSHFYLKYKSRNKKSLLKKKFIKKKLKRKRPERKRLERKKDKTLSYDIVSHTFKTIKDMFPDTATWRPCRIGTLLPSFFFTQGEAASDGDICDLL